MALKLMTIPAKIILFLIVIAAWYFMNNFPFFQGIDTGQQNIVILDNRISYRAQDVSTFFTLLGNEGREAYRKLLVFDYGFSLTYGVLLALLLRKKVANQIDAVLPVFPLIAAAFDMLENSLILWAMSSTIDEIIDISMLTRIKILFIALTGIALIYAFLAWLLALGKGRLWRESHP